jgi:peptidyl-prolyl cis-trans isomerase A (cyclophilin A)
MLKFIKPILIMSVVAGTSAAEAGDQMVELKTNQGSIRIELYASKAPLTVENFIRYVKDGHYNGTVFHRVIDNFMIQGGGFDKAMREKQTRVPIQNEAERAVKAGLKNEIGSIAMARTSNPHSATAQFFINVSDNSFLNWGDPRGDGNGYAVFGRVVSGIDVVRKIAKLPTGTRGPHSDVPRDPVVIESAALIPPGG